MDVVETLGRVLAEDIHASGDIPPYANSSMDGFAVRAQDTAGAGPSTPVHLRVLESLPAGATTARPVVAGAAIRIMTGAPLPPGADAVVKVEDTQPADGAEETVAILAPAPVGQYVRPAGEDIHKGEQALGAGTIIRPQEMGMLAALGRERVPVTRRPRVAILATGDELVPIDAPLGPGKIRNANGYSNAGQVLACGGMPIRLGIARDTTEELTAGIHRAMEQDADLLITSGGVSVGDFDLVKQVLAAEGDMGFWRVRMKPGKPLAFGTLHPMASSGNAGIPILGLPGNPVSAMVSFEMFARPAIMTMLGAKGWQRPMVRATLMDPIPHKDERRHYVRVTLTLRNGVFQAHLTGEQGSGILSSMVKANALAIIPEDWSEAPAGARVDVMILG